jgi:hypothetical protein
MVSVWVWTIVLAIISLVKGDDLGIFIIVAVAITLVYSTYRAKQYYKRYQQAQKILPYLHNTPSASVEKVDCYVKCVGTLLSENNLQAPLTHKACNMFFTQQWGLWQAKRKKPQKGYEIAKKNLATLTSSEFLLVKTRNAIIRLEPQSFLPNALLVMHGTKLEFTEPVFPISTIGKVHAYKNYEVIEYIAERQNQVVLLGKLVCKDAQLVLMPTFSKHHPSIFCLGDFGHIEDFVQTNAIQLYQYAKIHTFIPPLLNALMLIYLLLKQIA